MDITAFQQHLLSWYESERRDLPWRRTKEPYKIWVSEVMLQQTRVDTVIPYYERFIEAFPTSESFAYANEELVLKMWEGLGYYSRVKNLQKGVREVVESYGGQVPSTRKDISKLKGVGPYTAGAVLSIAYGLPEHAVDGNVMRVLARILLIDEDIQLPRTRKTFEQAVDRLISKEDPSSFNQGLMELGALICKPQRPQCLLCPVQEHCIAYAQGKETQLPVKSKKTKTRRETWQVLVVQDERGRILIQKRPNEGLLASLWSFPLQEQTSPQPIQPVVEHMVTKNVTNGEFLVQLKATQPMQPVKHVFSHVTWLLNPILIQVETLPTDWKEPFALLSIEEAKQRAFGVPFQKIIQQLED